MNHFNSIKELIATLAWSRDLLADMFEKRKLFQYKYDDALLLLESEERLTVLFEKGILRHHGAYLEIEEQYLQFFEQIMVVNEVVSVASLSETMNLIEDHIAFYLKAQGDKRRQIYLSIIKANLRKLAGVASRTVLDLNRNIENVFKTEPNQLIKISKLQSFERQRKSIHALIEAAEVLVGEEKAAAFYKAALEDELQQIITVLRQELTEARHQLIITQRQILEYLNQVQYQSRIIEKIKQVKYLKDQFELKANTNFIALLQQNNAVLFEPKPSYRFKLSLQELHTDEGSKHIKKVQSRIKKPTFYRMPLADNISSDLLRTETESEVFLNLYELRNAFISSSLHLYDFLMQTSFPREVSFEERMTIFCQMASMFEQDFSFGEQYQRTGTVEYAVVWPRPDAVAVPGIIMQGTTATTLETEWAKPSKSAPEQSQASATKQAKPQATPHLPKPKDKPLQASFDLS